MSERQSIAPQGLPVLAVGLMSGTSLDGIDAALIETDGHDLVRPLAAITRPYDEAMRKQLRGAIAFALGCDAPLADPGLAQVARLLTAAHAEAVGALLRQAGVERAAIAVIGFHGQTIAHRPERGWTWQIGDGAQLAAMTGCPVVNDFRGRDVAAGGQGAPLVPLYHAALVHAAGLEPPVAVVNIGGVANVTWVGRREDDLIAFDTGPGNALIDDWMREQGGLAMDADGAAGARGRIHENIVGQAMEQPWFEAPPPKSLDRHDFSAALVRGLSLDDGAATLAALTARAIARAAEHMPRPPRHWIVSGGGRHNRAIMAQLETLLGARPGRADGFGWDGDALEAQAFAYLAVRSLAGLPLSMPGTTGVPHPLTGGAHHMQRG